MKKKTRNALNELQLSIRLLKIRIDTLELKQSNASEAGFEAPGGIKKRLMKGHPADIRYHSAPHPETKECANHLKCEPA